MKLSLKLEGIVAQRAWLSGQEKQISFATSVALNGTGKAVVDAMPSEIERKFDRPTPFTKRGVRILKYANKSDLSATVGFMDAQAKYMQYQIDGGDRQPGPRGIKLPGNITLNSFGNIPRGVIDQLKEAAKSGKLSRAIGKRIGAHGDRRKGSEPVELFLGTPRGGRWDNAPMGIWRRIPGKPGKLVPVVLFENKPAHYKPKFDFGSKAVEIVHREWNRQAQRALDYALRTAR